MGFGTITTQKMTNSETSVSGDGAIVFKLHMKRRVAGMTCSTAKTLLSQRGHLGADGRLPRFMMHAQVFNCCAAAASELFNCSVRAAQAVQVTAQRPAIAQKLLLQRNRRCLLQFVSCRQQSPCSWQTHPSPASSSFSTFCKHIYGSGRVHHGTWPPCNTARHKADCSNIVASISSSAAAAAAVMAAAAAAAAAVASSWKLPLIK